MLYQFDQLLPNQVLQRDLITSDCTITFDDQNTITLDAGGPYYVQGKGPYYVGDVWVMAGQSNMRGHGIYYNPFTNQDLREPLEHRQLFLFDSSEHWRPFTHDPSHQLSLSPRAVHHLLPDPTVKDPAILTYRGASLTAGFANTYQKICPGIPLGLIASAHGGTSLNNWKHTVNEPSTSLYGAMIDKIKKNGYGICGILWYQGESDTTDRLSAQAYAANFKLWMAQVRQDLNNPDLPIVMVQIGPHRVDNPAMIEFWSVVQEQQRLLFGLTPFTAGVTSIDGDLDDRLHLSAKSLSVVGRRLAYAAKEASLGHGASATPLISQAYRQTVSLNQLTVMTVVIEFDYLDTPWQLKPNEQVLGFSLSADDTNKPVDLLKALLEDPEKGTVRLYLVSLIESALYVSYGLHPHPNNLITEDGKALPAVYRMPVHDASK